MCMQNQNVNTEIVIAIIGIIGTLLGTVLGWILNNISQQGKLNFYVVSWEDRFLENSAGEIVDSCKKEDVECYSYNCFMDIYNSSAETKIMRNIEIVFANRGAELWCETPDDYNSERFAAGRTQYDKIEPMNIPPKTVMKLSLHNSRWNNGDDLNFLWGVNKVFIRYTNEKNKTKKIKIKHSKMEDYIVKHSTEDTKND